MGQLDGSAGQILSLVSMYLGPMAGRPTASEEGPEAPFRCPFHKGGQESTPSFYLNLETGLAFCHTCHEGWNLRMLLARLGASRDEQNTASALTKGWAKPVQEVARFDPLPEPLLAVYDFCPIKLLDLGFHEDVLKSHDVGYDKRNDRITYPLRDWEGTLVGIAGGRMFDHQQPKYHVYGQPELEPVLPEYPLSKVRIKKSRLLWNFDKIWASCFRGAYEGLVVIVEGYKAALWVVQCGFPMVVALMGSYMSHAQADMLSYISNTKVLFLDQDEAGLDGRKQASQMLSKRHIAFRAVDYPRPGKLQPDDLTEEEVEYVITR